MATKPAKKTPKVRAPEEVWYDVHKHPEGVPGGMGKSPEYHLRNRGWTGHEINGAGSKTIQYRNHEHPDFVVSYGGGTPQKPDHNFRVLYMGGNKNIPRVTRAYSVAEAMNKVEELHGLHNGLIVQPMTHGAALLQSRLPDDEHGLRFFEDTDISPPDSTWIAQPMFKIKNDNSSVGRDVETYQGPIDTCETCYLRHGDDTATRKHHEDDDYAINHPFKPFGNLGRFSAYETPASWQDMTDDDMHPIGPPKIEFPTKPDREHDWQKKQKPQLKEIPDSPAPKPFAASKYARVVFALQLAEQETWEE